MYYPSMTRTNMRQRGPVETRKMNRMYEELHKDISMIYEKIEGLQKKSKALKNSMHHGYDDIVGIRRTTSALEKYKKRIHIIERGAK